MKRLYVYRIVCLIFIIFTIFGFYKFKNKECVEINEIVNKSYVFIGDSITEFYNLDEYFDNKYLTVNSGKNGDKVNTILNNLYERIYKYNPSDVVILIGINNYLYDNSTIESVTNVIEKITSEIHKRLPNCNIYIQSIYPTNNRWKKEHRNDVPDEKILKEKIVKTNEKLKEYCLKEGYTYINVYDSLQNSDGYLDAKYTNDGLHPNSAGYKKITKILKKYVFK